MESLSEAAYRASGCSSVTDFISSPVCQGVQHAYLGDEVFWSHCPLQEGEIPMLGNLQFSLNRLRSREEQGSVPRFLLSLPTLLPSCTHLDLLGVELASLDELAALCQGIASPVCTLRSLKFNLRLKVASTGSAKRLIADALARNTSLERLTITSDFCTQERWVPCSVKHLHVELEGDDTLDVLLSVLTALAHNSISLTTLSINGPYDHSACENDGYRAAFCTRSAMLDSEKQLSAMLSANTSLTSLDLYNLIMAKDAFSLLFAALNRNPNLTGLSLCGYPYLPGEVIHMLFTALEENHSLTSLILSYSSGEDWPSSSLILDSLRANGTLANVEFDETPYEEEMFTEEETEDVTWAAIFAQLESNRKNAEQMSKLASLRLK